MFPTLNDILVNSNYCTESINLIGSDELQDNYSTLLLSHQICFHGDRLY